MELTSNGFEKYIMQDYFFEYTKSKVLNVVKAFGEYEIIVINKIDDLHYQIILNLFSDE